MVLDIAKYPQLHTMEGIVNHLYDELAKEDNLGKDGAALFINKLKIKMSHQKKEQEGLITKYE